MNARNIRKIMFFALLVALPFMITNQKLQDIVCAELCNKENAWTSNNPAQGD